MKLVPFPYALNIGTDVVHLPRMYRLLTRRRTTSNETYLHRFTRRILCRQEIEDFQARFGLLINPHHDPSEQEDRAVVDAEVTTDMARWLAGRFAAKEAARKAAPGGATSIGWKDVLVRTAPASSAGSSRPEVVFLNGAESRLGKLSISHDGDYVVATVLAAES